MVSERNGAGRNIVIGSFDPPVPDCDIPTHQSSSGIAIFVSHNHSTASPMNGALCLMPVSEETETIPFASTLTLPFTLAVSV